MLWLVVIIELCLACTASYVGGRAYKAGVDLQTEERKEFCLAGTDLTADLSVWSLGVGSGCTADCGQLVTPDARRSNGTFRFSAVKSADA